MKLLVVGDGPELKALEATCHDLNLADRVSFLGQQEDVSCYYAIADVFVLPSHSEGSPNVLLEAMDAGVPIVATLVGGIPEIVTNDQDALLVESHDVAGMAAAMVRLLSDEELCTRLTAAARTVLERHTPEIYFKNIMSVLREVAEK